MQKTVTTIQEMANEWIATKSEAVFKKIMKRMIPGMHNHIMEIEKDPHKRSEILNDAFSKIWAKIDSYNIATGAFSTWVYKIVKNEALLAKRHSNKTYSLDGMSEIGINNYKNSIEHSVMPDDTFDNVSDSVIDDLYTCAVKAIENFPSDGKFASWKQALIMREIEGKPFNEIGKIMGVPEKTATGWVCKARRHLGTMLESSNTKLVSDYKKLKKLNEN